jgi:hypothetical protein
MSLGRHWLWLVAVMLLVVSGVATAQPGSTAPSSQLGISVGASGSSGTVGLQYAINPSVIIGARLGLRVLSRDSVSSTTYGVNPFARFLLEGPINPFFEVGLSIGKDPSSGISNSDIGVDFGLEYFASRNIGLFVAVTIFDLEFDPSPTTTAFGIMGGGVGAEWYFNR